MTNKPEPNTRAGEALKPCPFCNAELTMPTPVQYPKKGLARLHPGSTDDGSCPIAGWGFYAEQLERWNTRPLPQPSDEPVFTPEEEADLVAQINGNWYLQPNPQPSELVERLLAFAQGCRGSMWQSRDETIALMDEAAAQIAKLQADGDKLAGAATTIEQTEARYRLQHDSFGDGAIETGRAWDAMRRAGYALRQALTEWKDRA